MLTKPLVCKLIHIISFPLQQVKGKLRDLLVNGPDIKTQNYYTYQGNLGALPHRPDGSIHVPGNRRPAPHKLG